MASRRSLAASAPILVEHHIGHPFAHYGIEQIVDDANGSSVPASCDAAQAEDRQAVQLQLNRGRGQWRCRRLGNVVCRPWRHWPVRFAPAGAGVKTDLAGPAKTPETTTERSRAQARCPGHEHADVPADAPEGFLTGRQAD
jgi:hypothetical protein